MSLIPAAKIQSKKVGYLFIENLAHSFKIDNDFIFDEDAILTFSINGNKLIDGLEESMWKEWVGTIEWESLKRSNAVLEIKRESANPEIQNHENEEFLNKMQTAWVALKLVAPIHTDHCYKTVGYTDGEKIRINHYDQLSRWFLPGCDDQNEEQIGSIERIDDRRVTQWCSLYKALRFIQSRREEGEYLRIWLGLRSFEKACNEVYLEYRLPFFVRSIEALILPDKGKTTKQFKSRVSKWWSKDLNPKAFAGDAHKALDEIYDIRCDFDHLHGLKDEYTSIQYLRAYQCEQLVRSAYQSILLNEGDLASFKDNQGIQNYWKK